jgi:hypothetical protein
VRRRNYPRDEHADSPDGYIRDTISLVCEMGGTIGVTPVDAGDPLSGMPVA